MMMFAWDLDEDTHKYFRKYLDIFINKRKISKEMKGLYKVIPLKSWNKSFIQQQDFEKSIYNPLRHVLQYKINLRNLKDPPKKVKKNQKHTYYSNHITEIDNIHRKCPNQRDGQYW
tara:strand:+ start:118 stop:465 length:348 start_codon:yes stop_codon:yes gene_type:complete